MSARRIDHRTDVWALGVVLRELLTARAAFRRRHRAGVLRVDPPRSINYTFRYRKPERSYDVVHVGVGPSMLFARHGTDMGAIPVGAPKCPLQKALAVGYEAGLDRAAELVAVWGGHGRKWMINQSSPAKIVAVDDDCRETKLVP